MNSSSTKFLNSHSLLQPHSLHLQNIPFNKYKSKQKKSNKIQIHNPLYHLQRYKGNFKYIEKYIHKHFINFYQVKK